jgi:hypothetical protein
VLVIAPNFFVLFQKEYRMDCKTARLVWNHEEGFIAGVREALPGVIERLEVQVQAYVDGDTNPYHASVLSGSGVSGGFHIDHANTEDDPIAIGIHDVVGDDAGRIALESHFTTLHGQPIHLGNMCCGACITHGGSLSNEDLLAIQTAAVNTEPDGTVV